MKKAPLLQPKIHRLNYIGSKFQLLDWITENIKEKTGWASLANKTVADLFAGTGVVSYHFRTNLGGAPTTTTTTTTTVISNDAELYSSIITHAFTRSVFSELTDRVITEMNKDIAENKHAGASDGLSTPGASDGLAPGYITRHYSPFEGNERMFFTVENARRIDYMRNKLESLRTDAPAAPMTDDEYKFILASIILSADAVSNVPAVYGCFLKKFKAPAAKNLVLFPIHTITAQANPGSMTYNCDVLDPAFLSGIVADMVYLDPPYNHRQYSKNYFPLNIIAKTPEQLTIEAPLKGKTGIPVDCFISPFCKKGKPVEAAFETLFRELKTKWIFLSYSSESIVSKEKMLELMGKYGDVDVVEQDYKRFKSFEYNQDKPVLEYLFCLKKKA
jgi:adenine-specific DNA-methyltransferase